MGIPMIDAPSEAEAEYASLCKYGSFWDNRRFYWITSN